MKKIIYVVAMGLLSLNAFAQENNSNSNSLTIKEFTASINGSNLLLSWTTTEMNDNKYWEVQGSTDGKNYTTIGLVFGADPKMGNGNFSFKQKSAAIKPGMKFYRVLNIQTETTAFASKSVSVSK